MWKDQEIGPAELRMKLSDKFNVVIPCYRFFYGNKMNFDLIKGKWNDNFHMMYIFKGKIVNHQEYC